MERLTADRDDRAELIAHHLATALELRDALGQDTSALRERTLEALVGAARQAAARHDATATIALAEKALALDPDQGRRAELLLRRAVAHAGAGTVSDALLPEARDAALAAGRREDAVHAAYLLAEWAEEHGEGALLDRYGAEAADLAAGLAPGPITSLPAYFQGYRFVIQGRYAEALAVAEAEIARARAAGNEQAAALMLLWRGAARVDAGDATGVDDLREGYRILDRHAHPKAAVVVGNLGELLLSLGRAGEAQEALADGLAWARRIGHQRVERLCLAELALIAYHGGRADRAADLLDAAEAARSDEFSGALVLVSRGRLAVPDQPGQAIEHAERLLAYAGTTRNDQIRLDALSLLARGHRVRGERDASRAACDAFLERWHAVRGMHSRVPALVETGLVLAADGRHSELAAATELLMTPSPWADAARALAAQHYEDAAALLESIPRSRSATPRASSSAPPRRPRPALLHEISNHLEVVGERAQDGDLVDGQGLAAQVGRACCLQHRATCRGRGSRHPAATARLRRGGHVALWPSRAPPPPNASRPSIRRAPARRAASRVLPTNCAGS